jgi:hypothetical protein
MPCLFLLLALAFPRVIIVLLWLFSNFFSGLYHGILIPALGFLFLPLTFLAYSYFLRQHAVMDLTQIVVLAIAVILDLGLVGGGTWRRRVD